MEPTKKAPKASSKRREAAAAFVPQQTFFITNDSGDPAEVIVTEVGRFPSHKRGSRGFTVLNVGASNLARVYRNAGGTRTECRSCYFPKKNGGGREARGTTKCVHVRAVRAALDRYAESQW
jgi:hypothetical protein